uniref:TLE_N domain-containing protein n=1 Tax=Caenorhabditis japonica TaxID=281687 RepID=A0A8R1HNW2_CAEJA
MKPSYLESLERIKDEHNEMSKHLSQQRVELEKVNLDKENMTRTYMTYHEMTNTMRGDLRKAEEINKRLQEFIIQQPLNFPVMNKCLKTQIRSVEDKKGKKKRKGKQFGGAQPA